MQTHDSIQAADSSAPPLEVHQKLGALTRQLHDSLNALGLAEKLRDSAEELPDAKSRLSYIARLTGEAAEKVLTKVEQAKTQHDYIAAETQRITALMVRDPVATVAKGQMMNFLTDLGQATKEIDQHLTEIMMAQDFHDLTGQVIARVVNLAATIEEQLVQLLIQTAPPEAVVKPSSGEYRLDGPAINPQGNPDVVTDQSQVDDLLASLGF